MGRIVGQQNKARVYYGSIPTIGEYRAGAGGRTRASPNGKLAVIPTSRRRKPVKEGARSKWVFTAGCDPLPAQDLLHIRANGPLLQVRLLDMSGRSVRAFPAPTTELDLYGLSAGSYLLDVLMATGRAAADDQAITHRFTLSSTSSPDGPMAR
jgi:hypothetical protein